MASPFLLLRVALWCFVLVFACFMVVEGRPVPLTGCRGGHGSCLDSNHVSPSDNKENTIKTSAHGATDEEAHWRLRPSVPEVAGGGVDGSAVRPELRWAPSGPDPLHHNGGSPKRPQTP